METKIYHFKRRLINSIILSFVFVLILICFAYRLTNYYIETNFLKISEQKSLSELDLYHDGIRKITQEKIEDKVDVIETNSKSPYLYQALINNRLEEVDAIFKQILGSKNHFDILLVFDNKGKLLTTAGLSEDLEKKIIYINYSEREYYKQTMQSKRTYISNIFKTYGDFYAITVSTPIFDSQGKVKYILTGSDKLENLIKSFNFKARFTNLFSILVDKEGTLLVKGSQPLKEKINVINRDKFVRSFIFSEDEKFSIDTNFDGIKSYIRGSTITLENGNNFYLFSYLPYHQSQKELDLLKVGVRELYIIILFGALAVFIFGWLLSVFITRDLMKRLK